MAEQDQATSGELVLRLYAVARGLEDEGQNNIAKLFRAAALGEMYRTSQDRPRQGAGLEEVMRGAVSELVGRETTSESFRQALNHALDAFERGDWPLLTEIPQVHVCRFCGEVMVGERVERCPTCGARPLSFQESPPVFYLEPLEPDELRQALRTNLAEIERYVDGVSEDAADRGVWPMRDMVSHLLGAQELMFGRARRMLAEDYPNLGSIPPTQVRGAEDGSSDMAGMLDAYRTSRRELIELADTLTEDEFSRPGYHPEWGRLTVLTQLSYLLRHEQSHLAELQARREGR